MSANKDNLEAIIADALETSEGRTALAQAMVEPIKTSIIYSSRDGFIMKDELPNFKANVNYATYITAICQLIYGKIRILSLLLARMILKSLIIKAQGEKFDRK